jgi:dTDP-4-dehydrorhamnose 3,5-epimerase
MRFLETAIPGAFEIHVEPHFDERGFFARTWCQNEFAKHDLNPKLVQCSLSFTGRKRTLRGMHYQAPPFAEVKLVRCTRGSIFDVVVDLRRDSKAFKRWFGATLTADNHSMLYVPEGCAHGFLTLEDDTEVAYQMSQFYNSNLARGVRYNDAAFEIAWPEKIEVISERDRTYPDFR